MLGGDFVNNDNLNENNHSNDVTEQRLQSLSNRNLSVSTNGFSNRNRNVSLSSGSRRVGNNGNDKLGNSRLIQRINNSQNHQRPNLGVNTNRNGDNLQDNPIKNGKNNDVGSQKLRKSIANKTRNIFKNNNRKKENNASSVSDNNSDTSTNNNQKNTDNPSNSNIFGSGGFKVRLKIKIILYSVVFVILLLIFLAFLLVVFGVDITQSIPAVSPTTYGTEDFTPTFKEGTNEYKAEINYYKKLKEVSDSYAKNHSEELKTNYIHAVLIYLYYQVDMGEVSEKGDDIPIDYNKMTNMVDIIVSLMMPSDSSKTIDYEKNGEFYNNLKNSSEFKNYYKKLLQEKNINDVIDNIFDFAKSLDEITYKDDTVVTKETTVSVEKTETTNGKTTKTTKTISMNDYIADSIYANSSTLSSEMIKAYTIAYSTNIVSQNKKLTIDSNTASASNSLCSVKDGCSYDTNGNLVSGGGSQSSKNTTFYNGKYYYKTPLTSSSLSSLNSNINSVYGNVLVNSDGTYPTLDINKINGLGDGDYKSILNNSYGSYTIKNIGEDSYILDGSYGSEKVITDVIFYDQGNYASTGFCGKKNETIKSSGCGVTSMAMIVSTYENSKKYDPVYMMKEAKKTGYCGGGIVGTSQGFFKKEANTMKYKYLYASKYNKKDLNNVLKHLSNHHLIIAHMSPGHFTGGGHYIVLGGVDPSTKKVYVYDPNHKSNSSWRKTGNGWYSFNDIIVKESWGFYIVWKG